MKNSDLSGAGVRRMVRGAACLVALVGLAGCESLLDVEFPGTIPAESLDDPSLAPVLARSVLSDFECAYSNFSMAQAAHSDEYETSNQNVPLANFGERTITAAENAYVTGTCASTGAFGHYLTMHTARFQGEDIYQRLSNWTDAEVPNRTALMALVRAYGAYSYLLLGAVQCAVAFDGGAEQPPSAALQTAADRFTEALTLAQQAGDADLANLSRVGRARALLLSGDFAGAEADAALVTPGYLKNADRGAEHSRVWNDVFYFATQIGAYTVAFDLRTINDPRLGVVNSGRGAFIPTVPLWITTKAIAFDTPIRLASDLEANLIRAEALIRQNQVQAGMDILNARRAGLGLGGLQAATEQEAMTHLINERRMELSFEGGHRIIDILRFDLPWKGANGSTQNANPVTGRPYGQMTCWPHPTQEVAGA